MDKAFWHERWHRGEIAFHEQQANAQLVTHLSHLALPEGARIFLPLCGKTNDIPWLLDQGYSVVGVELSALAVTALFDRLQITPRVTTVGQLQHYRAVNIDIFCGDIFDVTQEVLGHVDAVYDRAALVALPAQMRHRYSPHVCYLTSLAPQLLITFDYDQALLPGPPFSVNADEVFRLYGTDYQCDMLASEKVKGGLKGKVDATSEAWYLSPRPNKREC